MEAVCKLISEQCESEVSHSEQRYRYATSEAAKDLERAGVLNKTSTQALRHEFEVGGEFVAQCDYLLFDEPVGYIKDVFVAESLRNNGIGSRMRLTAIHEVERQADKVYSYPTNPRIRRIAEKQGFVPVTNSKLDGWFVRR